MNYFKETKLVPEYVKRILKANSNKRSADDVKVAANGLSSLISQFLDYPQEKRHQIAKYALFEEYEPGKIVLRQDKRQRNFYFIIQGICTATKKVKTFDKSFDTFVEFCSQGHSFGEKELIYKSKRATTITTSGYQNVCLLSIHEDDFFRIIEPLDPLETKINFLNKNVPILNSICYPFESLNVVLESDCFTSYYRSGMKAIFIL